MPRVPPSLQSPRGEQPPRGEVLWYAGAVALGTALVITTAITQPYNQNEWVQIAPYGSSNIHEIVSGTRQPPLDPLLGALVQHLLGVGQLRQRLVPALCGIGSLVLLAALLRRMRLGAVGVLTMFVLATAPVFLRYSAYIRPYALPTLLILLAAWAGSRWLEDGRGRWLALAALGALLLPLSRVPEPTVFLATSALVLAWRGWRGTLPRRRAWLLGGSLLGALVTVGVVSLLALASKSSSVFDSSVVHALHRTPKGAREVVTYVLPLLAHWFPWWPVTLVLLALAVALPAARRELRGLWFWLPLVLAPVAFLVAYHTFNPYPLHIRHYRARFAYFFAPGFIILVAAVGRALSQWAAARWTTDDRRWHGLGAAAVGVLLVSQLPTTYDVVTHNDVPDFGQAGDVLRADVPADAVVLYDAPAPSGLWRMPFFGRPRYLAGAPEVTDVTTIARSGSHPGATGPVYLLLLDSRCASSVVCDLPGVDWSGRVPGFRVVRRFDRFALYAPTRGQRGDAGAVQALGQLAEAYGGTAAKVDVFAQARLLKRAGDAERARRTVDTYCAGLPTTAARACLHDAERLHLDQTGDH